MFTKIAYFNLAAQREIQNWDHLKIGDAIQFRDRLTHYRFSDMHPYFCITPTEFNRYSKMVFEHEEAKTSPFTFDETDYSEDDDLSEKLIPIEQLKNQFVFLKIKQTDKNFIVEEMYLAKDIFDFWMQQNLFSHQQEWKSLGIGKTIFNLLPANHNYYDRNIICTCGMEGCYNMELWYIKYSNHYAIPFVIDVNSRMVFDLHYLNKATIWEEEDYIEEPDLKDVRYSTFPFCFEAKNFKLFSKTIFPNQEVKNND